MKFITAKFSGVCIECGDRIEAGDVIGFNGRAAHRACVNAPEALPGDTMAMARKRAQDAEHAQNLADMARHREARAKYNSGEAADVDVRGDEIQVRHCSKAHALEIATSVVCSLSASSGVPHRLVRHRRNGKIYTGRELAMGDRGQYHDGYGYRFAASA